MKSIILFRDTRTYWFHRLSVSVMVGLGLGLLPSTLRCEEDRTTLMVVVGAEGEEAYRESFATWAKRWQDAGQRGNAKTILIASTNGETHSPLTRLRQAIESEPKKGTTDVWLVLIGHGTFDGKSAKFNLEGEDLTSTELGAWLKPFERRLAVVICSSASSPFLNAISGSQRTVITATRSGSENNYSRYGDFLSSAIGDLDSDLDKDGQVSLLEAHLTASKKLADFYSSASRLATEHPLLDDNGDGFGTPADWFRGIRATRKAKDGAELDGLRAHQLCLIPNQAERDLPVAIRHQRDAIELEISQLRERKATLDDAEYYKALESLLLRLGEIYQRGKPSAQGATQ